MNHQIETRSKSQKRKAEEMEPAVDEKVAAAAVALIELMPPDLAAATLAGFKPKPPAESKEAEHPKAPAESKDEKTTPKNNLLKTLEKAAKVLYELSQQFRSGTPGIQKNIEIANELLIMAADLGLTEAEHIVMEAYGEGRHGFTKDETKAAQYYRSAANKGNAHAQSVLGWYYQTGLGGLPRDEAKAFHWFKLAEAQGNAYAQYMFACAYREGDSWFPQDVKQAIKYYKLAAKQGYIPAENNLGFCYETGFGVEQNLREAVRLYLMAAPKDESAQANLGVCFQNAKGLPQSDRLAFERYSLAAAKKPFAKVKLGLYYLKGIQGVVDKNPAKAAELFKEVRASDYNPLDDLPPEEHEVSTKKPKFRFFEQSEVALIKEHFPPIPALSSSSSASSKAEKKGEISEDVTMTSSTEEASDISKMQVRVANTFYDLTQKFHKGITTTPAIQKDNKKSLEFCELAVELGSVKAETELGTWHENGLNGLTVNQNKAAELFRSAADKGNAPAQNSLGNYAYFGWGGIERDEKVAVGWYQKSASQGNSNAYCSLGICHEQGTGVTKDLEKAIDFYLLSNLTNNKNAQIRLGICFQTGRDISKNPIKAFNYYSSAAEKIPFAKAKLAICHELGFGTPQNSKEAARLFNEVRTSGYDARKDLPRSGRNIRFVFEESERALIEKHFPLVPAQISPPSRFTIFTETGQIQQPVPQPPIAQQPSSSSAVVKNLNGK